MDGVFSKPDLAALLSSGELEAGDAKPVEMLFLGPYAVGTDVDRQRDYCKKQIKENLKVKMRAVVCEPPFAVDTAVEERGYWIRPYHHKPGERRVRERRPGVGLRCSAARTSDCRRRPGSANTGFAMLAAGH